MGIAFIDIFFFGLLIVMAVLGITQIIIPIKNGTPLFPMLMTKHRELNDELAQAKDDVEVSKMEQEIRETRKQAKYYHN